MSDDNDKPRFEEVKGVRTIAMRWRGDYVQFVLREWEHGGHISISGSYEAMDAGFSFSKSFAHFLSGCDMCYMMDKLTGYKLRTEDWEESIKALKRAFLNNRREYGREADGIERAREDAESLNIWRTVYQPTREAGLTKEKAREVWDAYFSNKWSDDEETFRRAVMEEPEYVFGGDSYELVRKKVRDWIPFFWTNFWLPFLEYLNANPTVVPEEKSE